MARGSMSLSAFLRNRRVPGLERSRVPLVCDELGIVWVVGHRIAERVRLTEQTRETLGLRWDSGQFGELE
jgi:tRNA(Ile)-lysidine synthase